LEGKEKRKKGKFLLKKVYSFQKKKKKKVLNQKIKNYKKKKHNIEKIFRRQIYLDHFTPLVEKDICYCCVEGQHLYKPQ